MNSNVIKKRRSFARKSTNNSKISQNDINNINNNNNIINNNSENPVENIRKQLEKLEDLGDQLPSNDAAYTLRYPFQDKGKLFSINNVYIQIKNEIINLFLIFFYRTNECIIRA